MKPFDREALERSAFHIRSNIVRTIASNGEGHAGGALSAADILAVLYFAVMDYDPEDPTATSCCSAADTSAWPSMERWWNWGCWSRSC